MGKEIIVDELVRDAFIYENNEPAVGLLIGAHTESGEFCVAHLAQTLEDVEINDSETGENSKSKSFMKLLPNTLSRHAKQVIRMLPGGLYVLGFYIVEPVDNIFTAKHEETLKSLLTMLNKGLTRNPHYSSNFGTSREKIIFHYNPSTKKFVCKVMDCSVMKTKPMETSFSRLEWAKLECEYDTISAMHLAKQDAGLPLKKHLQVLMKTFQDTLDNARFLVDGQFPSTDIVFEEPEERPAEFENGMSDMEDDDAAGGDYKLTDTGTEVVGDGEDDIPSRPISPLHILVDKVPGILRTETTNGDGHEDFINHLHLQGKIAAVAFVRVGCSTTYAVQVLREDILRSMASRIDMHCDSLIDEDSSAETEESSSKVYHEVPRRVFANLPGSKLLVSDYLFPGEGPTDSVISFRDILSLKLEDESEIIVNKEKPFDMTDIEIKGSMEELLSKAESITKLPSGIGPKRAATWIVIFGFVVGVCAFVVPHFSNKFFTEEIKNN